MAILRIKGTAEKEYHYDVMTITVTFRAMDHSSAKALDEVMKQSESFLETLQENGVDISQLQLGRNELSEYSYKDELNIASRGIKIRTDFNMAFLNDLNEMLSDKRFDILMDTSYEISNENELRDNLIKEAIEDSKKIAELACSVTGQKIVGIKKIDLGDTVGAYLEESRLKLCSPSASRLSDMMQSPTTTLDESVTVIWEIQ
jgi:uncharacterized protein YggE